MARKTENEEIVALYVGHRLRMEYLGAKSDARKRGGKKGVSYDVMAKKYKSSTPAIHAPVNRTGTAGPTLIGRFARVAFNNQPADLEAAALEWWRNGGEAEERAFARGRASDFVDEAIVDDDESLSPELAAVLARRRDLTPDTTRMLRSYRGAAVAHLTEEQWDLFASQIQGVTRLVEMQATPKPTRPSVDATARKERYAATPLVRQAGLAQGYPASFVNAWQARFQFAGEPDFETLWNCMRDDYAAENGLPRTVGVTYPKPGEF